MLKADKPKNITLHLVVENALMFLPTRQSMELPLYRVFQTPNDHLWKQSNFIYLSSRGCHLVIETNVNVLIIDFVSGYKPMHSSDKSSKLLKMLTMIRIFIFAYTSNKISQLVIDGASSFHIIIQSFLSKWFQKDDFNKAN